MAGPRASSFRFRLTRAGAAFLVLALVFGAQAILVGSNTLFLVFALMAGFGSSLALVTILMPWRITVTRRLPAAGYAGEPLGYSLTVRNDRKTWTVVCITITDQFARPIESATVPDVARLGPGEAAVLDQVIAAPARGWLAFAGVQVRCRFPFGLCEANRFVPVANRLLVYPQRWVFQDRPILAGLDGSLEGLDYPGRFAADRADFAGLREFQPGDHPRHIHWHASGRVPEQILTRQYEPQVDRRIAIVLDSFYRRDEESRCRPTFEEAVGLALSLADKFLAAQYEVIFAAYYGAPRFFPLRADTPALGELRRWLAMIEPEHDRTWPAFLAQVRLPPTAKRILLRLRRPGDPRPMPARGDIEVTPDELKPFTRPRALPDQTSLPANPAAPAPRPAARP